MIKDEDQNSAIQTVGGSAPIGGADARMLTTEELREIEARASKAMLPEWRVPEYDKAVYGRRVITIEGVWTADDMYTQVTPFTMGDVPTAEFIAHAREDVPRLAAEVRRLRRVVDAARERIAAKAEYESGRGVTCLRCGRADDALARAVNALDAQDTACPKDGSQKG